MVARRRRVDECRRYPIQRNYMQTVGMNEKDARLHYWYRRPLENWPPESVQEPGEIRSDGRLSVSCIDQTLSPLFTLRRLEVFHAANWWDNNELRELEPLNPKLTA